MTNLTYSDSVRVELIDSMGSDSGIIAAARVSTGYEKREDETDFGFFETKEAALEHIAAKQKKDEGLIQYLMREKHGCYSSDTEVLTQDGWKFWPDVSENDKFLTRDLDTGLMEYQTPSRIVRAGYSGDMIKFSNKHLNLLVTPNHNMVSSHRINSAGDYTPPTLRRADTMVGRAYRVPKSGGVWVGKKTDFTLAELALLGFFIGDGSSSGATPTFNIRKTREISFLEETVAQIPKAGVHVLASGARSVVGLRREVLKLLHSAYTANKEKHVPSTVRGGSVAELSSIFSGLMASDGTTNEHRQNYFTTSAVLAGHVQELAVKIGLCADIRRASSTIGKFAGELSKPVFAVGIFSGRNANPRLGWTKFLREKEITTEKYTGTVYCATVPSGTLYVRRNGKTAWSGNSPFEHNSMTFRISAPIFVFREFHRHRIGWSYNEQSGRYSKLSPEFYVPKKSRPLVNVGTSAAPEFAPGTDEQFDLTTSKLEEAHSSAWDTYEELLNAGVANEVARVVLPVGIYSTMYATCNARSLMAFLSLRTMDERAKFKSRPQHEITLVAARMEEEFANLFPITYEKYNKFGRVAP